MTAPALDPKLERIAQTFEADLRTISTGGGFYTEAGRSVYQKRQPIEVWNRFPALFVEIPGEELTEGRVDGYASKATILVIGYVQSTTPRADVLRLAADAKKAILSRLDRGTVARETRFVGFDTDIGTLAQHDLGEFVLTFEVDYDWSLSEP